MAHLKDRSARRLRYVEEENITGPKWPYFINAWAILTLCDGDTMIFFCSLIPWKSKISNTSLENFE